MSAPTQSELDARLAATVDLGHETRGLSSAVDFKRHSLREQDGGSAPTAHEVKKAAPLVRKPERFTYERGIARASWSEPDVELKFDLLRLDRRSGELSAELTVLGGPELLHRARLNLASTRTRSELTN